MGYLACEHRLTAHNFMESLFTKAKVTSELEQKLYFISFQLYLYLSLSYMSVRQHTQVLHLI